MNVDDLKKIVEIVEKTNIEMLNVEKGDFKLNFHKNQVTVENETNDKTKKSSKLENNLLDEIDSFEGNNSININVEELHEVKSPLVGTFYSRPEPGKDPYVKKGTSVAKGDVLCVLEAMKLLNEVKSDVNGEVKEVLVNDGDVVEYNQPLFLIKVSEKND